MGSALKGSSPFGVDAEEGQGRRKAQKTIEAPAAPRRPMSSLSQRLPDWGQLVGVLSEVRPASASAGFQISAVAWTLSSGLAGPAVFVLRQSADLEWKQAAAN